MELAGLDAEADHLVVNRPLRIACVHISHPIGAILFRNEGERIVVVQALQVTLREVSRERQNEPVTRALERLEIHKDTCPIRKWIVNVPRHMACY